MTRSSMSSRQVRFDRTPEIFATDSNGGFSFSLAENSDEWLDTSPFDEVRLVLSVWHPSASRAIDLDSAYMEIQGRFDPEDEHWIRLAEIEPIVPAYSADRSFDGWIVLPVLGSQSAYRIVGSGLAARARLQIRSGAYFVT